ncbi:methyltransferase domain-containing protein [Yimella sp. cx-51]|uniref:methyltransferase domain-containing protein n=1 Tax=Yimella sp. cx-51 TaxID=2770551 RepID=UPI00165E4550|nr:methyltransferase domain-containing protein [Yimella sp. cx-51]MBC9956186.1 methyltransferase domain-containing protein [Yimella sp. cx-51]QTH38663.1 methyltransferase domain-containing protein [Yimella sp. cx-51]
MAWDAMQYEKFDDHRTRPFRDLLARVPLSDPARIVDLGCGNGLATLLMARRWPDARITGVDSSPQMLDAAREHDLDDRVEWVEGDVAQWNPSERDPDLIVTNATLQWVPGHEAMIEQWLDALPAGGAFAMQVPGNFSAPSHRIIREAVADHPRSGELKPLLRHEPVLSPEGYAELLASRCAHVDAWETTYVQILDPAGTQANPVLEWVQGTALRPILAALDDSEQPAFLADLDERLAQAYPRRLFGVPFPFRRIFAVGVKGE